jgi:predicted Zn-dependent protease with MMP-like domain
MRQTPVPSLRVEQARRRRFERLVARALDALPPAVAAMLDNVEVVVEDEPTPEQVGRRLGAAGDADDTLFGLYEGVPLIERGSGYTLVLPDKITIFRGPLERAYRSPQAVAREVRVTVMHELAHHLGFDEDGVAGMGLD